jgi:hypothetical protein
LRDAEASKCREERERPAENMDFHGDKGKKKTASWAMEGREALLTRLILLSFGYDIPNSVNTMWKRRYVLR